MYLHSVSINVVDRADRSLCSCSVRAVRSSARRAVDVDQTFGALRDTVRVFGPKSYGADLAICLVMTCLRFQGPASDLLSVVVDVSYIIFQDALSV